MKQTIFTLKLHETMALKSPDGYALPFDYVMRVASGWVYSKYDTRKDEYVTGSAMFVPLPIEENIVCIDEPIKVDIPEVTEKNNIGDIITTLQDGEPNPLNDKEFVAFLRDADVYDAYITNINRARTILKRKIENRQDYLIFAFQWNSDSEISWSLLSTKWTELIKENIEIPQKVEL